MEIFVNGDAVQVPESSTVSQLLVQMDVVGKRIAVEINRDIIPRSQHASHAIQPGDKVEIVQAIGGG